MLIRPATLADLEPVVDLLSSMEPEAMVFDERGTWPVLHDLIAQCPNQGYVAEDQGIVIACVFITDKYSMLHSLAVARTHRRRGIATKLVRQILHDYHSRNDPLGVNAMVSTSNEPSLAFLGTITAERPIPTANRGFVVFYLEHTD